MKNEYSYQSKHFYFRTIQIQDTEILVKWRSNPDIIKYFYNTNPVTIESHLSWYNNCYLKDCCRYDFIVFDGVIPVGFVALTNINFDELEAEINYTIGNEQYQKKGFGCELIKSIIEIGEKYFKINNFVAYIHKNNIASKSSAIKCGFTLTDNSDNYFRFVRN